MLDSIIAFLAPERGLKRALARQALSQVRDYEGAKESRRTRGWRAGGAGPNAEVARGQRKLRDRARDLARNNPWVDSGVAKRADYEVGTGIRPRSRSGSKRTDKKINALFDEWSRRCDVTGRWDFYGVQRLLSASRCVAGEGIALLVTPTAAEMRAAGLTVPLQLQVIEPDLLGDAMRATPDEGNRVVDGVEVTPVGRPVAYHFYGAHPGEAHGRTGTARRVEAARVIHLFQADRPGQLRGVSELASVLIRARMLDELEDAAIEQAKVSALVAAFTTSQGGAAGGPLSAPKDGDTGERRRTMSPGMIHALQPGEDVEFNTPPGAGGLPEHYRHQLRAIAAGLGMPYDLLTGDLTQANYSSLRAGRLAFRRRLEVVQWLLLIPQMCQPIWDAFIAAAVLAGHLPPRAEGYPCAWGPPRFELLDPQSEAKGIMAEIRMGLRTEPQAISEAGEDPDEQLEEIAAWNAKKDALGVVTDSDPRKVGGNGQVQPYPGAGSGDGTDDDTPPGKATGEDT